MVMVGWILMKTNSSANLRFGLALGGIKDTACCARDMLRFEAAGGWEEHKRLRATGEGLPSVLLQCPQGSQSAEII